MTNIARIESIGKLIESLGGMENFLQALELHVISRAGVFASANCPESARQYLHFAQSLQYAQLREKNENPR